MYLIKVNIYTSCYFNKKESLFKKSEKQYVEQASQSEAHTPCHKTFYLKYLTKL